MFWKPNQYPELKGLSALECRRILTAALSNHGRALIRRFYVAIGLLLGTAVLDGAFSPTFPKSDWRWWVLPIAAGAVFGTYLLWEVNGPLHRTVARQLADHPERADTP